MLAEAYGLNPQGGSILAPAPRVQQTEPEAGESLLVERGLGWRSAWAYFLRADTMHSLYSYLEENSAYAAASISISASRSAMTSSNAEIAC